MRIGIDISQSAYPGTGVSRFVTGLTRSILAHKHADDDWIFFFSSLRNRIDPQLETEIRNSGSRLFKYPLPPTLLSLLWNRFHVGRIEWFTGELDWFISSDWTEPPADCKKATIVHDLVFRRYPETVHPKIRKTQEQRLARVAQESNLIWCDSQATRDDLISLYKIPKQKVFVNYPGVDVPTPSAKKIDTIKQTYRLHKPYILTVGKLEPRKNIPRLIDAFAPLSAEYELVIAGPSGWGPNSNPNYDNPNIRLLGFVPDEDLYALYTQAEAFAFPSLYEGFGYPALEAMQLLCPVAASRTSSLSEIVGAYGVQFDPTDTASITHALRQAVAMKKSDQEWLKAAAEYAHSFTWNRTFTILMESLLNYRS